MELKIHLKIKYHNSFDSKIEQVDSPSIKDIDTLIRQCVPINHQSQRKNKIPKEPWFDNECLKMQELKYKWLNASRNNRTPFYVDEYGYYM